MSGRPGERRDGFRVVGDEIEFVFDPAQYNQAPAAVRSVNVFNRIDRKYYFRLNPDLTHTLRWHERERTHAREDMRYYRDLISFRLSDAGRALRVADLPSMDYVRFIENGTDTALGWIVNGNAERPGVPAVMVLGNAGGEETTFQIPLPPGRWGVVGDGNPVHPDGIPGTSLVEGYQTLTLRVEPQTALILRNGF